MTSKPSSSVTSAEVAKRTRRAFLRWGAGLAAAAAGWVWVRNAAPVDEVPWPLRRVLEWNGALWNKLRDPATAPSTPVAAFADGTVAARVNGDVGLDDEIDPSTDWSLAVEAEGAPLTALHRTDLLALATAQESALFCCVEGWSQPVSYTGVRFSELLEKHNLGRKQNGTWYLYVGLATPDGEYYVSVDMASMRHPQTLLATHLNGFELTPEHGAPVRLMIPIKYGIKSLKRIGKIAFSDTRPPDYWSERGYDWHAGL